MPRFFTLPPGRKLLPQVESAIREAITLKAEYDLAEAECQSVSVRVLLNGGMRVDRTRLLERTSRRSRRLTGPPGHRSGVSRTPSRRLA
ncbi:MAG: hypothetical protein ABSH31_05250 [Bryobacteraceae bacterium]